MLMMLDNKPYLVDLMAKGLSESNARAFGTSSSTDLRQRVLNDVLHSLLLKRVECAKSLFFLPRSPRTSCARGICALDLMF